MWSWRLILLAPSPAGAAEPLHHQLRVQLDPPAHRVSAVDTLAALPPSDDRTWHFTLHQGMEAMVVSKGWTLERAPAPADPEAAVPLDEWILRSKRRKPKLPVSIAWKGAIDHPPEQVATEYQRSFSETPGIIGGEGVYLARASSWLPTFGDDLLTFDLTVSGLPDGWTAVSQGERVEGASAVTWKAAFPTEEVYLVAGPWRETDATYERADGSTVAVRAMLREDDPALANRYLQATRRYLKMYESMLPQYPYPSFALVENFWETGYGMPGFTLLGPEIIRFPFILTSSYPHELLHNWWGNGAYVDYDRGNWCEGLTSYLADHMLSEQRGEGGTYRRNTLQRYSDFVDGDTDFPLVDFGNRNSASSEAVGYGKSLMLFHMLRRRVGDEAFTEGLGRFFEASKFQRVSYPAFVAAMDEVTGEDWGPFVDAWTTRTGAPTLALTAADAHPDGDQYVLDLTVAQTQDGDPFPLQVPVAVTVAGAPEAQVTVVDVSAGEGKATLRLDAQPLRVDVDPLFDVMRRLDPLEVPPAVSTLISGHEATFVVPAEAPAAEREAWEALAAAWAKPNAPKIVTDAQADQIPAENVWFLGWGNRAADRVLSRLPAVKVDAKSVTVGKEATPRAGHSVVLVARSPDDPGQALGWVTADPPEAIAGLARKLPHYTRYSHLAFAGAEPQNTGKGTWEPTDSPLSRTLSPDAPALKLPERDALVELPGRFEAGDLLKTATAYADPALAGRGLGSPGLQQATEQLQEALRGAGLQPAGDDGFLQPFEADGPEGKPVAVANVVAEVPGTDPALAPVLVTAHLDHLGTGWPDVRKGDEGQVHPGADDNASGVAVALELARVLAAEPPRARAVRFAFTTGEEAGLLGARHLLGALDEGHRPFACVNLDTVGRLGENKLQVIGADSAREWRFAFMGIGYVTGTQSAFVAEPLATSDQVACHEVGVPGVQLFSGPNTDYHRPSDTADKLDGPGMARVADVAYETVAFLAERTDPLTVQLDGAAPAAVSAGSERTASLGTMPDFTFGGPGVKVQEVGHGSAAEAAGIRAGDVIVALGKAKIADLRGFSDALKEHQPGDRVDVHVERGGKAVVVHATLGAR
ncbi:MAG: M20/M25/M40 family metallo-hydrolase [Myxococcota bacterium]